MKSILDKKGQLRIGDAPGVVLIVLFLFMCMGTAAYVLDRYAGAFGSDEDGTVINETVTQVELAASTPIDRVGACNFGNFAVTEIWNATAPTQNIISLGNYTVGTSTGIITNITGEFVTNDWIASYTFNYAGLACNVTEALTEEVEDNTSIAGMILTIALIGIVLSILIGLFYVFTGKGGGGGM